MKKEEILEKSRKDNEQGDEREEQVSFHSFGFGIVIVAILCIAFSIIKAVQGERCYEFGVIIFGYLSASNFYQFSRLKNKKVLISAIATLIVSILGIVAYFLAK